ncbi:MAG TPA: DNA methyltransferase, partial [Rhodoferax sp.]|nr:DNA methyltransferase [Rhodoferax sp.]
TYIAESTAQKTKLYDMYARFFRWASDRLNENGVLAFVTNRSFIESRTFDGFRKTVASEFADIYVVDLGGDVRANPKLSGTKHNVFGIQTGVAISFMVKRAQSTKDKKPARVYYVRRPEMETAEEKLGFLANHPMSGMAFDEVQPDKAHNWVNLTSNDFETLIPLASKDTKVAKTAGKERAIFKLFSLGVVTARDEWVYDESKDRLSGKIQTLIDAYNADGAKLKHIHDRSSLADKLDTSIKWSRATKRDLANGVTYHFEADRIVSANYRPFVKQQLYFDGHLNEMRNMTTRLFGEAGGVTNSSIVLTDAGSQKPFMVQVVDSVLDYHYVGAAAAAVAMPIARIDDDGQRHDNITDWALKQFAAHYADEIGKGKAARKITKEGIFHYCYAVLHDPLYREKYAQNLKREFPRIPFYKDFWQWAAWGEALMALHIGYEGVAPFALTRTDVPDAKARAAGMQPKAMLRADPAAGSIALDSETTLSGIPAEAWTYKLGNRSAIDWVLDQYKEKKPKDPTIREKFDTYRFADYKDKVIDLLMRVTTVSVETVKLVRFMKEIGR